LLPLFVRPFGLSLLFIRRASTLSRDAGHLAFPGGRHDGDESMLETALRETEEEIGLDRGAVTVLGALSQAFRVSDRASVAPFVGLVEGDPTLVLNPAEVEAVIEVPLAALYDDGVSWEEIWVRNDASQAVQFFADDTHFGDDLLWGLSARIVWDLLMRLWNAAGSESEHR
jgi:8-oxo-dGTP pyrophosphatase MutT (NUDIX family)